MSDKNALITGASKGIGKAIALRLSQLNYSLLLIGRDSKELISAAKECEDQGATVFVRAGDLTDDSFRETLVPFALDSLGFVDVLINNAGSSDSAPIQEADLVAWDKVLDLNVRTALHLSRNVLPHMIERRRGAVINISSIQGRSVVPTGGIYCATKHAINGLTGCMFEDVREYGIKVSSIMPGYVETRMTKHMKKVTANMLAPDDVADAVEYVLSSSPRCCPTELVLRPQRAP